ncbi:MAG: amidohydrolase family protein [Saprospiraceae bacterium]|nr:amidohydrolase family protein [Saprospiraceae bacterium]
MKKINADRIHTISGDILHEHVIVLDDSGQIKSIDPISEHDRASVEILKGDLIPGFVNAHCHLELSHMKGLVHTGTTLLPFLQSVVKYRDFPEDVIQEAIQKNDAYMYDQGIMAVGDISNKTDSFETKRNSPIRYYTFVEYFDLMQKSWTEKTWKQYQEVYELAPESIKDSRSNVPHAPYSMTPELFSMLKDSNSEGSTISIHNQETPEENQFLIDGSGAFRQFFEDFGFSLDDYKPIGKRSIHYALQFMRPDLKTIFVHNTTCTPNDLKAALAWNSQIYWATCPNANLYIENRLPNYRTFMEAGVKMCIGTDSLSSNWQLSVFEEIRTMQKYQSYVPFESILKWATINGAEALGFDDTLGTIEVGKSPGLVLLQLNAEGKVDQDSTCKRIV